MNQQLLEQVIAAYSLNGFPYCRRELDPQLHPGDFQLVSWVDGWAKARDLGQFLEARTANGQPAIMLVSGGSGTGRSSLANTLVHMWATSRQNMSRPPLVARWPVATANAEEQMWQWALTIDDLAYDAQIAFQPSTANIFQQTRDRRPEAMGSALTRLLKRAAMELRAEGAALVGILEGVGHPSFLPLAAQALTGVDACMVMTVDDTPGNRSELLSQVDRFINREMGETIQLTELSGADVCRLVQHQWSRCTDVRSPFPDAGLERAFDNPRRSLRDVLDLVESLLVNKVDLGRDDRWPETDRLGFTEEELVQRVPDLAWRLGKQ